MPSNESITCAVLAFKTSSKTYHICVPLAYDIESITYVLAFRMSINTSLLKIYVGLADNAAIPFMYVYPQLRL